MHIPDGFISPKVFVPAYGVAAWLWLQALKKIKQVLNEEVLPFLSVTTAFSFILMMVVVPLPGGTTVHAMGIGILAVLFGPHVAFLCISLVLLIQALFFGNGGITTLPINAIAIGYLGGWCIHLFSKIFKRYEKMTMFVGPFLAVMVAAGVVAVVLGIQPLIAHNAEGKPLFFPFGLNITLPAVLIPNAIVGVAEGVLTVIAVKVIRTFDKGNILEGKN
ncbi:MAG: energy-coupling factor ABC transporter permease [Candidatus Omnitrophota bacterium]